MKKIKGLLAVLAVAVTVLANTSVAQAAEQEITVRKGAVTVQELTEAELRALPQELVPSEVRAEWETTQTRNGEYTAYRYSRTFEFSNGDLQIAQATPEYIVWHYTDGKVHLYSRTISMRRIATYDMTKFYGSIVNTDGSYSYTTGDRIEIGNMQYTWTYALDFYVTPTDYDFLCYEID